jgi:ribosomal-protein-alanine N-acetyltransferase
MISSKLETFVEEIRMNEQEPAGDARLPRPRSVLQGANVHQPFTIIPMKAEHGPVLSGWHYEAPFDIFNWPAWEEMTACGIEFGDPSVREKQYAAVTNIAGELAGFAQFFPLLGVMRLGLGMRPDLCGHGLGLAFTGTILDEAKRRAAGAEIDLEVLTWNTRAIRVYEKAGFEITDTYTRSTLTGPGEFHCMVWKNPGT